MKKAGRKKRPPRKLAGGFFSIERRLFDGDLRGDMPLMMIWLTLLCWANPTDAKTPLRGQKVPLKRGQVATGVRELAEEWDVGHSTVQRCLRYLEETGRISTETGTHGTVVTILKYDEYQRKREKTGTQFGTQPAHNRHTTGTQPVPSELENQETIEPFNHLDSAPSGADRKKPSISEECTIGRKTWTGILDKKGNPIRIPWDVLDGIMTEMRQLYGIEVIRHIEKMAISAGPNAWWRQKWDGRPMVVALCEQVAAKIGKRPEDGANGSPVDEGPGVSPSEPRH